MSTTCACTGDLYIEIDVANDPYFKREKNDIYTEVHVGIAQAALGCTVDVVRYWYDWLSLSLLPTVDVVRSDWPSLFLFSSLF